jgi:hypothetical protein
LLSAARKTVAIAIEMAMQAVDSIVMITTCAA